jgi:hypothetical protein
MVPGIYKRINFYDLSISLNKAIIQVLEEKNYLRFLVGNTHFIGDLLKHAHVETLLDVYVNFLELILIDVIKAVIH